MSVLVTLLVILTVVIFGLTASLYGPVWGLITVLSAYAGAFLGIGLVALAGGYR